MKRLDIIERKNGLRQRWQENERAYQAAKSRLDDKNRTRQMFQLHKLASERIFLLEMKKKYAGILKYLPNMKIAKTY